MPRTLTFSFKNAQIAVSPEKVDRSKLYGFIDVEALDSKGRPCTLATLADDGRTLVGVGGTSFGVLSPDGEWLDKSKLKPVNSEGLPIQPVPSSYAAPVPLEKTATIEEYLSHNIKGVYVINPGEADASALFAELKKGTIFSFPYSFRGGLEADAGFLLMAADGTPFMAIGQPTSLHFVGLETPITIEEDTGEEGEGGDEVDFSMM